MEDMIEKLKFIKEFRNNTSFIQEINNFFSYNHNNLIKSHYDDLMDYFIDSTNWLNSEIENKNIFHFIGVLQIIYVQQDLMDELLTIYLLKKSKGENKDRNRRIRNQIFGHPLSKIIDNDSNKKRIDNILSNYFPSGKDAEKNRRNILNYSVFMKNFNHNMVHYGIYQPYNTEGEKKDKTTEEYVSYPDIINRHKLYLNKYLDKILLECKNKLNKVLEDIILLENDDYENKINKLFEIYNVQKSDGFKKDFVFKCIEKSDEHPRYKYYLSQFDDYLFDSIQYGKESTSNLILEINNLMKENDSKIYKRKSKRRFIANINSNNKLIYSILDKKMYDANWIESMTELRREFSNNKKIFNELNYLGFCNDDDREYEISKEYLMFLLSNAE